MTAPTNGHGHGHGQPGQQQPFIPDPHFAVQAQQEEIDALRQDVVKVNDRNTYLRAVVLQVQAEAQHQASLHLGEIENYKNEVERLRRQLFDATGQESGDEVIPPPVETRGGIEVEPDPADIRAEDQERVGS